MIRFFKDYEHTKPIAQFLGIHTLTNPFERVNYSDELLEPFVLVKVLGPTEYVYEEGLSYSGDLLNIEMETNEVGYVFSDGEFLFEKQIAFTQSNNAIDKELLEKVYMRFYSYRHENIQVSCDFYGSQYDITASDFSMATDNNNNPGTFIPLSTGFGITPKDPDDIFACWLKYTAKQGTQMGRFFCPAIRFKYDLIP